MTSPFTPQIDRALGAGARPQPARILHPDAALPAVFAVSDLAVDCLAAAAREASALLGAPPPTVDRRLALLWYGTTLRPLGWQLPSLWDPIAGDYRCADGWIRLHTNAPHHRAAALTVLACPAERPAVAHAVAGWDRDRLEGQIVAAGGAAAAMRSMADWAAHPQGRAVAAEPLIAWQPPGDAPPRRALQGLRVLDLTRVLAGPVATRFLAAFGAEVLRIDPPQWDEPGVVPEVTPGKRRAGLDLHRAADRHTFETLLAGADVLVHGYRPGALDRLGYDAATRRRLAPGLIDVSLNAYGWTGPWAGRRGFDSLLQMSSGIAAQGMARNGADRPVPLPVQALDHATGYLMAAAVLRALRCPQTGAGAGLSLARTATLLLSGGPRSAEGAGITEGPGDQDPTPEDTAWGPARRLRFPLSIPGHAIRWSRPAGPLRSDPPAWTGTP